MAKIVFSEGMTVSGFEHNKPWKGKWVGVIESIDYGKVRIRHSNGYTSTRLLKNIHIED
jgi:hypothetical protein